MEEPEDKDKSIQNYIYNNNFVFVQDGNYISLYDIAKKEKKGTYETIKNGETSKMKY